MLSEKLKEISPSELGRKNDLYGLQFGSKLRDRNIRKVIVCIDPTKQVILEAAKQKIHFIISYHGLMHTNRLFLNDDVIDQIKLLSMNDIDLFVLHSAWAAANGGISESLTKLLGLAIEKPLNVSDHGIFKPLGRIGSPIIEPTLFKTFLKNVKRHLNVQVLQYYGNLKDQVEKVGVICGISMDESMIKMLKMKHCDTVVAGNFSYSDWILARKLNLKLISIPYYISLEQGMKNFTHILSLFFPRDEIVYIASQDPISYLLEDKNP